MKLNFSIDKFKKDNGKLVFNKDYVKSNFPTKRKENWKFTDLDKILNFKFEELNIYNEKNEINFNEKLKFDHYYLVSINGNISNYNFGKGDKSPLCNAGRFCQYADFDLRYV